MVRLIAMLAAFGILMGAWSVAAAGPPMEPGGPSPYQVSPPPRLGLAAQPNPTNLSEDQLIQALENEFVNQPSQELSDLDLGNSDTRPARDPFAVELPPPEIMPVVGAPWAYHQCWGISPLHTSQMVLERRLGRPLRIERDAATGLSYHYYDAPNAHLIVGISTGVVIMVDAIPKLPLVLGGAIDEFELSTPVKVPRLAPTALRGPPLPAGQEYYRCGYNVVAVTQPGTGQNEGDVVTRVRFHAWRTDRYGSDSDAQFGRLPPKFVLEANQGNLFPER